MQAIVTKVLLVGMAPGHVHLTGVRRDLVSRRVLKFITWLGGGV
jgi:hypothetical protein